MMTDRIVETRQGRLQGIPGRDSSVTVFRGVPYAQPPVGPLRWREPQPPRRWYGIRPADHFGPIAVQKGAQFIPECPIEDIYESEDCLFLNLWVPENADGAAVLVWFYGGAFQGGFGSDTMFDGESFARQGVIVVTLNYRVGLMGFLPHPDSRKESPGMGNFGLLDQIAALQWVRDNIAAFGGDPGRVTIAGQSAGGGSVCNLIASPLAAGLFCRAITESGDSAMPGPARYRGDPAEIGLAVAKQLGDGSLESLRKLPSHDPVRADYDAAIALAGQSCVPIVDGAILPEEPWRRLNSARGNNVPMLVGSNLDEGFLGGPGADYEAALSAFGAEAEQILRAWPRPADPKDEAQMLTALGSVQWKLRLAVWARLRAERLALPTWQYQFCLRPGGFPARHSAELAYVFNSFAAHTPRKASIFGANADHALAEAMNRYWANFIRTGDPNGEGLSVWASKAEAPERHMRFDHEWGMADDLAEPREALVLPSVRRAFDAV